MEARQVLGARARIGFGRFGRSTLRFTRHALAVSTALLLAVGFLLRVGAAAAVAAPAAPSISVGPDVVVGEADGHVDIPVTLSNSSTQTVKVHYTTMDGTASSFQNADFVATSGVLNFAPGETTKTVRVDITDGVNDVELMQSFTLDLTKPVDATISRAFNRVEIVDNDTTSATPALYARNAVVDETAGAVSVPVLLGGTHGTRSNSTVTVDYTTNNGTALAGSDYTTESGTLTFTPGQTVQNITVPITNDNAAEGAERFTVTLSNPANSTIANSTGVVTIAANDATPVASPTISAGPDLVVGETDGYMDLTVALDAPSTNPVSVHYSTVAGTASSFQNADFVGVSGVLNFAPGETTKTIRVDITDGVNDVELMESFTLDLSRPVNATIARAFNRVDIVDNDTTATTPGLYARNAIVDETAGAVNVPVLLGGTHGAHSNSTVTVNYATSNDNATAGSDYTAQSGQLTFAPGQSVQNIVVPITNDNAAEGAERFDITLSNPANSTIANGTGVVTIAANDSTPVATPTISVGPDAVVGETDGYIDLTVALNAPSTNPVSVHYSTVAGTASSFQNADFVGVAGILNYAPGETTKTVRVDITDGVNDVELMQSFTLDLTKPVNATISRAFNRVSILDNDTTLATPALSVRNAIVDETAGTVSVPVLLGGTHGARSNSTVTVSYATSNDNATAGSDYTAESGQLTFAPGQSVQNIVVPITNDTTAEGAERFDITLSNPANSTIANGTGVVTIAANDSTPVATPTVSTGAALVVGENDGYVDLTVSLNHPSTNPVSVHFTTVDGTASSFQYADFVGVAGILNFAPGETTKAVRIEITDNTTVEARESFHFRLSRPVNATFGTVSEKVAIRDND